MMNWLRVLAKPQISLRSNIRWSSNNIYEKLEPVYLTDKTPKPSVLPEVNIQLKGYDYTVLQEYQSWVAKSFTKMGLKITDRWATPAVHLDVTKLKPGSQKIEENYNLKIYERTVQVGSLPSYKMPLLIEVLQASLPQGVSLAVDLHSEEASKIRYVPDLELRDLRAELEELER